MREGAPGYTTAKEKKGFARGSLGEVGGLAQLARAPALQAGGHRFDSDILHEKWGKKEEGIEDFGRDAKCCVCT